MNALKEYLLLIVISVFLAHNVGTAYGEILNTLLGSVVAQLEQVQRVVR